MQLSKEKDQSRIYLLLMVASALALVGVVVFGIVLPNLHSSAPAKTPTAATGPPDPAAEAKYRTTYQAGATAVKTDSAAFAATSTAPGVCNKGGTKQACVAAGEKVLGDLKKLQTDLKAVPVPARYGPADALLKQGIQAEIDGLTLRDTALTSTDPTASAAPGNARIAEANALFKRADQAFPADARPAPSLAG